MWQRFIEQLMCWVPALKAARSTDPASERRKQRASVQSRGGVEMRRTCTVGKEQSTKARGGCSGPLAAQKNREGRPAGAGLASGGACTAAGATEGSAQQLGRVWSAHVVSLA